MIDAIIETVYPIAITYLVAGVFLSTLKMISNLKRAGQIHIYLLKRELGDWFVGVLAWPLLLNV